MSLSIPYNLCEILDDELIEEYIKYYPNTDTYSEVLEKPKPLTITKFKGITLRIGYKEIAIGLNKKEQITPIRQRNIVLTLSAKLLKSNYFQGINKNNIKDLYNEFMKFEIFKCSYQTFINSHPTDIDICSDRHFNNSEEFKKVLRSLIQQTENNKSFLNHYNKQSNLGLQFNHRDRATNSKPYYKLYFKQYDLETKSLEFAKQYLPMYKQKIQNLVRIEATIKNASHKRHLKRKNIFPEFKTLEELLNISDYDKNEFLKHALNSYILKSIRLRDSTLSPTNQIISELISQLMLNNYDQNSIIGFAQNITMLNKESERKQIIKTKNLLIKLCQIIISKDNEFEQLEIENKSFQGHLKWLGLK